MPVGQVKVKGLRELNSALKRVDQDLKKDLERELRDAGQIVAADARQRFLAIDARSAEGFRPRIRGFGRMVVEQSRRRTTGRHPEFGALQMRRALLPALAAKEAEVVRALDGMLDRLGKDNGF